MDKKYKRVILKLSGEALSGGKGHGFDEATVIGVAGQVKRLVQSGIQVGIVIGGGNFWRGRSNPDMDRTKADQIGMLATVMNCLYTSELFRTTQLKSVVMTPFAVGAMTEKFSKEKALDYMAQDTVVFFAGGTGHPFFSTDTAVALRALEVEAEIILLAKNVDGVYDKDPSIYADAVKFDKIALNEVIEQKLGVMDLTAAIMCLEHGIPMLVFHLNHKDSIINAINNESDKHVSSTMDGTLVYI
ncbi:MAG: UMP kinase [Vallitaleaceae bacterium]|jgi:uridylate kinase|nr:UMP kinase [Vallitaleaceae bacterium]